MDEAGHLGAGFFVGRGGLFGQGVDAAMDVGVVVQVEVGDSLDHLARLLAGGRGIQVHQRHARAHLPLQYGEILPNAGYIKDGEEVRIGHGAS